MSNQSPSVQYYSPTPQTTQTLSLLDPALVEANRRGEITPEQAAWLRGNPWTNLRRRAPLAVALLFVLGTAMFVLVGFSPDFDVAGYLLVGLVFAGILGIFLLPRILRALRASSEIASSAPAGLVRQTSGELSFERGNYQLRAGDQILSLPLPASTGGLLPGLRYTVNYQEGKNVVLSAEQLGGATSGAVRQALTAILARAHRFGEEELQANRNGELTLSQRNILLRSTAAGGAPMLFGVVFALGVLYPFLAAGRFPDNLGSLAIPLGMAAFLLASGGFAVYKGVADALSGPVESVQGAGQKSTERRPSGRSRRTVYLYNIGDQKLEVPQSAFLALIDGLEYRVWYVPRSRRLLSIEAVDVPGISPFGD